jgi:TetR/AcrR family acrAB operon transcriptional repressor
MTRGAIYWHFKDKNALFQAMCDRAFLPMEALLNEISDAPQKIPSQRYAS